MNTFSRSVSKRLREIGVEEDTDIFWLYGTNGEELCSIDRIKNSDEHWIHLVDKIPAYTLHDIFRLMPKIGEKMEFGDIGSTFSYVWNETMSREPDSEDECIFENHKENRPPCEVYSHHLLDAFLSGDYPACEIVLLELLKEHA